MLRRYITALDASWHNECFKCGHCGSQFASGQFTVADGKPFCNVACANGKDSLACAACGEPATEGAVVTAGEDTYHKACFVCRTCSAELGVSYVTSAGRKFCNQTCFENAPEMTPEEIKSKASEVTDSGVKPIQKLEPIALAGVSSDAEVAQLAAAKAAEVEAAGGDNSLAAMRKNMLADALAKEQEQEQAQA